MEYPIALAIYANRVAKTDIITVPKEIKNMVSISNDHLDFELRQATTEGKPGTKDIRVTIHKSLLKGKLRLDVPYKCEPVND
ncbi:hypothetical protein PRIPAC_74624 [Pristionchus pacificus]|uniref:Uncharacterized protein n=1 Tax=Pristionchus pacificus TaxID=54126 RepID=A0A2A6BEU2_PRIPA|nr:hypothetical protein PRIPAC_74624 [Pristionchus pacificus]|eukprot:PDM64383.1 hypothetical protein PRIPAC_52639 [Pristionchus pacificus]